VQHDPVYYLREEKGEKAETRDDVKGRKGWPLHPIRKKGGKRLAEVSGKKKGTARLSCLFATRSREEGKGRDRALSLLD